jgi:hypothetical protein
MGWPIDIAAGKDVYQVHLSFRLERRLNIRLAANETIKANNIMAVQEEREF